MMSIQLPSPIAMTDKELTQLVESNARTAQAMLNTRPEDQQDWQEFREAMQRLENLVERLTNLQDRMMNLRENSRQ